MSVEKLDKIKKRINALLSKTTENGATEEEMTSALDAANRLMLEHFITEHDLKMSAEALAPKCKYVKCELPKTAYRTYDIFIDRLAKLFDCEHYWNQYNRTATFYGFSVDAELCGYFFDMIMRSVVDGNIKFKRSEDIKELKAKGYSSRQLVQSWINGYLVNINRKLDTMYKDKQSNIPQTYALVVAEKIDEVKRQFDLEGHSIKEKSFKELYAYTEAANMGKLAAEEFQFTQGLNSTEAVKQLDCSI